MSGSNGDTITFIDPGGNEYLSDGYENIYAVITPPANSAYTPAVQYVASGIGEHVNVISQTYSDDNYDVVVYAGNVNSGYFGNAPAGDIELKGTLPAKGEDTLTISTVQDGSLVGHEVLTITPPAGSDYGSATVNLGFQSYGASVITETDSGANYSAEIFVAFAEDYDSSLEVISGTLPSLSAIIPCYVRGTQVLTTRGNILVEDLVLGDQVVIVGHEGRSVSSVQWIGHCSVNPSRHKQPLEVMPVRIRAGAFGNYQPSHDLLVSPGHRIHLDGGLVRAIDLINGATVLQEEVETVEYWHIELALHSVMIANGCEAESYQDTGNRASFDDEFGRVLHPVIDGDAPHPCRPFAMPSTALRERLVGNAEVLGWVRSSAACPYLEVGGLVIEPEVHGNRLTFLLPVGCTTARLCSRSATPAFTDANSADLRRLGLRVTRISLTGETETHDVPLDHALLHDGFSHLESDESGRAWRWTDGNALLPLLALNEGHDVVMVEVILGRQEVLFWEEPLPHSLHQLAA